MLAEEIAKAFNPNFKPQCLAKDIKTTFWIRDDTEKGIDPIEIHYSWVEQAVEVSNPENTMVAVCKVDNCLVPKKFVGERCEGIIVVEQKCIFIELKLESKTTSLLQFATNREKALGQIKSTFLFLKTKSVSFSEQRLYGCIVVPTSYPTEFPFSLFNKFDEEMRTNHNIYFELIEATPDYPLHINDLNKNIVGNFI